MKGGGSVGGEGNGFFGLGIIRPGGAETGGTGGTGIPLGTDDAGEGQVFYGIGEGGGKGFFDEGDVIDGGFEMRPAVEGIDMPIGRETEPFEHHPGGFGFLADFTDEVAGLRGKERDIDFFFGEEGEDELFGVLAEAVGLGIGQIDESPAEVLPEGVAAVRGEGGHHLGDNGFAELVAMHGQVVEAGATEELAEAGFVSPIGGGKDEAADFGVRGGIGLKLEGGVNLAGLEVFAVKLALANLEVKVGFFGGAYGRGDE